MRKIYSILGVAALSTLALVSCNKEAIDPAITPAEGNKVTLTINATQSTKTIIDGTSVKWATSGEKLKVFEVYTADGSTTLTPATSSEGTTEDDGATMSFAVSFDEATADALSYYAFYPSSAYDKKPSSVESVAIEIPSTQTPTATSFDPAADILVAKPQTVTTQATSLDMAFARVVAVCKMTLTGLASSDPVTKVTFSAIDAEGKAVTLAGRTQYNLNDASKGDNNTKAESIILDYSSLSLTANESMDVWFTCLPFSLEGAGSFKLVVETATQTFTKEVSLTSGQKLNFIAGKAARFSVNMSSATADTKAKDLCYAELTYEDFNAVYSEKSYGNETINKTHGDTWGLYAANGQSSIQLRNTTSSDNDSYIKLPDFVQNIGSVTVTLSRAIKDDQKLTLETAADTYSGSIASVTTVADQTEYTFDLTSLETKYTTAYLRSVGATAYITKVSVLAGTDTRTALAAPASVTAAVDAETVNTINVSWDAVSDAASYIVTLYDGDVNVVKTVSGVSEVSYSFTDLSYSSSYIVTVKASPSDYYTSKDSNEKDSDVVKTGAEPAGVAYYVKVTTSPDDWAGTYLLVCEKNNVALSSVSSTKTVYGDGSAVTISDNKIQSNSTVDAYQVVIAAATTTSGAYTFSLGTLGYLTWSSGNSLKVSSTDSANSNWTIAAGSTAGNWVISNSNDSTRQIWYNTNSPRFACYTGKKESDSGYAPVQLYKLESSSSQTAKTTLSTPEIFADVQNTNEIYVMWDAVSNAGSYIVTCTGQSNQTVTTTEATFKGLANGTYTVTVTAVPTDTDTYSNSEAASATVTVSGSSEEAAYYIKITSTANLTDGQYLIVYETGSLVFDGSLTTLDAASNTQSVTISDSKIEATTAVDGYAFTYDASAKTLKSASGYYIGRSANLNGLNSSTSTTYTNTISFDTSGNAVIQGSGTTATYLKYNSTSGQTRFRYYKSGQKDIQLYKRNH